MKQTRRKFDAAFKAPVICVSVNLDFFILLQCLNLNNYV